MIWGEQNLIDKGRVKIGSGVLYFRSSALSTSLAILKLSNPEQTLTRWLLAKNPVSDPAVAFDDIPISKKAAGAKRVFGFGLSSFLKDGNR